MKAVQFEKQETLFERYDVNLETRRCVNIQGKTSFEVLKELEKQLDPDLLYCLDYSIADSVFVDGKTKYTAFDPDSRRVIVYTVKGGSEGYYLHIDMIGRDGTMKNLILFKTLGASDDIKKLERAIWEIVDKE